MPRTLTLYPLAASCRVVCTTVITAAFLAALLGAPGAAQA
jgi:hypothetical protein